MNLITPAQLEEMPDLMYEFAYAIWSEAPDYYSEKNLTVDDLKNLIVLIYTHFYELQQKDKQ